MILTSSTEIYLRPDWRIPSTTVGKYLGGFGIRVWPEDEGMWIALYTTADKSNGPFAWILKKGYVITPSTTTALIPAGGCSGVVPVAPCYPWLPVSTVPVCPWVPVPASSCIPWIPSPCTPWIIPVAPPATAGLTREEIAAGYEEWSRQWKASLPKGWIPGRMTAPFPPRAFWESYKASRTAARRPSSSSATSTAARTSSASSTSNRGGKNWRRDQTVSSMGLRFRDVAPYLTDKWFMFTPLDLTREGRTVLPLIAANTSYIGNVTVSVSGGNVTVNYMLNSGVDLGDLNYTFFSGLSEVNSVDIWSQDRLEFGKPVDIDGELDGADVILLYLSGHVSYNYVKQPRFHPTGRDYRKAAESYRLLMN